jgi:hypothetical protein
MYIHAYIYVTGAASSAQELFDGENAFVQKEITLPARAKRSLKDFTKIMKLLQEGAEIST